MAVFHRCEHCGAELPEDEVSRIGVQLSKRVASPRRVSGMFGQMEIPQQELFELCIECCLAIMIGLKSRKVELTKQGRVVVQ